MIAEEEDLKAFFEKKYILVWHMNFSPQEVDLMPRWELDMLVEALHDLLK